MNVEILSQQYSRSLENTQAVFEDVYSEIAYIKRNHRWILNEKIQKYKLDDGDKIILFGAGNVAFISKEILENSALFEGDSWYDPLVGAITHAWGLATNIGSGGVDNFILGIGGLTELLGLVLGFAGAFAPFLNPFVAVLSVTAGIALIAGGGLELFNSGSFDAEIDLSEKTNEDKLYEYELPKNSIEKAQNGLIHLFLGFFSLVIGSLLSLIGGPVAQLAKKQVGIAIKTWLERFINPKMWKFAIAKLVKSGKNINLKSFISGGQKAIKHHAHGFKDNLKHAASHTADHVVHAQVSYNTTNILTAGLFAFLFGGLLAGKTNEGRNRRFRPNERLNEEEGKKSLGGTVLSIFANFSQYVQNIVNKFKDIVGKVTDWISNIKIDLGFFLEQLFDKLKSYIVQIIENIKKLANGFFQSISKILTWISEIIQASTILYTVQNENGLTGGAAILTKTVEEANNIKNTEVQSKIKDKASLVKKTMDGKNLQTLGDVQFDTNKARLKTDDSGKKYLIVKDENTGKDFGVIRQKDGTYDWYKKENKTNENYMKNYFMTHKEFIMNESKHVNENIFAKIMDLSSAALNNIKMYWTGFNARLAGKLTEKELNIALVQILNYARPGLNTQGLQYFKDLEKTIREEIKNGTIKTAMDFCKRLGEIFGAPICK